MNLTERFCPMRVPYLPLYAPVLVAAAVACGTPAAASGQPPTHIATPVAPIVTQPAHPSVCQYDVTGRRHRIVRVGLPFGQTFPSGSVVVLQFITATGAASAVEAHPQKGTAYVEFRTAANGGAGTKHRVDVRWSDGVWLRCGRS